MDTWAWIVIVVIVVVAVVYIVWRQTSHRTGQALSVDELKKFDRVVGKSTYAARRQAEDSMSIIKGDSIPGLSDKLARIGFYGGLIDARDAIEDFLRFKAFVQRKEVQAVQQLYAERQAQLKRLEEVLCAIRTLETTNSVSNNESSSV